MPQPLYTPENTRAAYQLNWSYALFWHATPKNIDWLEALKRATEKDHIRILNHSFDPPNVSKFLVSTLPAVAPELIPHRVKGRLQHLLQRETPNAFRRNYSLRSIGSTKRDKVRLISPRNLSITRWLTSGSRSVWPSTRFLSR